MAKATKDMGVKRYEEKTYSNLSSDELALRNQMENEVSRFGGIEPADQIYMSSQKIAHKVTEERLRAKDDEEVAKFRVNSFVRHPTVANVTISVSKEKSPKAAAVVPTFVVKKRKSAASIESEVKDCEPASSRLDGPLKSLSDKSKIADAVVKDISKKLQGPDSKVAKLSRNVITSKDPGIATSTGLSYLGEYSDDDDAA